MHILYLSENLIEALGSIKALPSHGYIWINATPSELNVEILLAYFYFFVITFKSKVYSIVRI